MKYLYDTCIKVIAVTSHFDDISKQAAIVTAATARIAAAQMAIIVSNATLDTRCAQHTSAAAVNNPSYGRSRRQLNSNDYNYKICGIRQQREYELE